MTLALFVGGERPHWLRAEAGDVVERGEGRVLPRDAEERVVAVVPGHAVAIHRAVLPGLTEKQARAAARLLAAENSITAADQLHVAVGEERDDGSRTVVAIDSGRMADLLAGLAADGVDPRAVVPAPLLIPAPDQGYVRAELPGETVVRGRDAAFTEEPALAPLIDVEAATLSPAAAATAVAAELAAPEVDLRQGPFALRRRWTLDWVQLGRVARLALLLGLLSLAIEAIRVVRLDAAAAAIERRNAERAQALLPPGVSVSAPGPQLEGALAQLTGPGGGFLPLASLVANAVNATPNSELVALNFDASGSVRASVRALSPGELVAVQARLQAAGAMVTAGAVTNANGRALQDFTVRAR